MYVTSDKDVDLCHSAYAYESSIDHVFGCGNAKVILSSATKVDDSTLNLKMGNTDGEEELQRVIDNGL